MVDLICPHCDSFLASLPVPRGAAVSLRCPSCEHSFDLEILDPYATCQIASATAPLARSEVRSGAFSMARPERGTGGWSTLFQPGSLTAWEGLEAGALATGSPSARQPAETGGAVYPGDGTLLLKTSEPEPLPRLGLEAFFLVPGQRDEPRHIPLTEPQTTFGRTGADVNLGDDAVSGLHFQVEALGHEFFIRDLESRNGTFLNGRSIRYCELRPGDEVLAGRTVLVFQTSEGR